MPGYVFALTRRPRHQPSTAWWPAGTLAAWSPIGAASLAESYADLTGNGHAVSLKGSGLTLDPAAGWHMHGTAALDTGLAGTAIASIAVKIASASTSTNSVAFGVTDATNRFYAWSAYNTSNRLWSGGGPGQTSVAGVVSSGILIITGNLAYLNGILDATMTSGYGSGAHPSLNVYIGGRNNSGTLTTPLNGYVTSACVSAGTWTQAQVTALLGMP